MSRIEDFQNPSGLHQVQIESGGFSILPIDESNESLVLFQKIAKLAIKYRGGDFSPKAHYEVNTTYEKIIDLVFFEKSN